MCCEVIRGCFNDDDDADDGAADFGACFCGHGLDICVLLVQSFLDGQVATKHAR